MIVQLIQTWVWCWKPLWQRGYKTSGYIYFCVIIILYCSLWIKCIILNKMSLVDKKQFQPINFRIMTTRICSSKKSWYHRFKIHKKNYESHLLGLKPQAYTERWYDNVLQQVFCSILMKLFYITKPCKGLLIGNLLRFRISSSYAIVLMLVTLK